MPVSIQAERELAIGERPRAGHGVRTARPIERKWPMVFYDFRFRLALDGQGKTYGADVYLTNGMVESKGLLIT